MVTPTSGVLSPQQRVSLVLQVQEGDGGASADLVPQFDVLIEAREEGDLGRVKVRRGRGVPPSGRHGDRRAGDSGLLTARVRASLPYDQTQEYTVSVDIKHGPSRSRREAIRVVS